MSRWIEELSQYNVTIQHRSGSKHTNADALSRIPDNIPSCSNYNSRIEFHELPCEGCAFCARARNQWNTFEDDIDYVVPLTVRAVEGVTPHFSSTIFESYSSDFIRESQSTDPDIQTLVQWLMHNHTPNQHELSLSSNAVKYFGSCHSQLFLRDGIL